jgi:hypothetical protein
MSYLVIHCKHEGCYEYKCYEDDVARIRFTSITINPPKVFIFRTREEAQEFFEEYINDVDCIDIRCKRGDEVEHMDYCSCGVIELDDKEEPVLFYNKKNQIFLLESGPQVFLPTQEIKNDIRNFNLTNRLIRKCKSLAKEQRDRYIELGKYCEECNLDSTVEEERQRAQESNGKTQESNGNTVETIQFTIESPVTLEMKEKETEKKPKQSKKKPSENKEGKPSKPRKKKGADDTVTST